MYSVPKPKYTLSRHDTFGNYWPTIVPDKSVTVDAAAEGKTTETWGKKEDGRSTNYIYVSFIFHFFFCSLLLARYRDRQR